MSGSAGAGKTQTQKDREAKDFNKELENNTLLKNIYLKLDEILFQLKILTEEENP